MNPALYEMEMLMCDWYAKAIGLPQQFSYTSKTGGGILMVRIAIINNYQLATIATVTVITKNLFILAEP